MKIKLKNHIISVLVSLVVSLPTFAMIGEYEENDRISISSIQSRFNNYKNIINTLEEEKIFLQKSNRELEINLQETDELLEDVVKSATPLFINYLQALYKKEPEYKLEQLRKIASKDIIIPDLITRVHKQVRKNTPLSTIELLNLHGDKIEVTENLYSINYSDVKIPSTPTKKIESSKASVEKSIERQRRKSLSNKTEEVSDIVVDLNKEMDKITLEKRTEDKKEKINL